MYSVSDAAKMLNVNEETVRRWIRDGKLKAKRAVGRGGNTLYLEDIIAFANHPPRAYLLSLEAWLIENHIAYKKIEDSSAEKNSSGGAVAAASAGVVVAAAGAAGAAATGAGITSAASAAVLATGPVGLGVVGAAGLAYGATKLLKRKNYQKYSIQLLTEDEADKCTSVNFEQEYISEDTKSEILSSDLQNITSKKTLPSNSSINPSDSVPTSNSLNVLNEIACAKQLLDSGVITSEEFADIKARLIAKI